MVIKYNNIEKETAKAILVNASVCWNEGKWHEKNFWMPKSIITIDAKHSTLDMKDWFYEKLCRDNAYHGYIMDFAMRMTLAI